MSDDELIARWIEPHPRKGGKDEAVLKDSFISVWAIAGYLRLGESYEEIAAGYEIPREAVEAAAAYYRRYRCLIDNRIEANMA